MPSLPLDMNRIFQTMRQNWPGWSRSISPRSMIWMKTLRQVESWEEFILGSRSKLLVGLTIVFWDLVSGNRSVTREWLLNTSQTARLMRLTMTVRMAGSRGEQLGLMAAMDWRSWRASSISYVPHLFSSTSMTILEIGSCTYGRFVLISCCRICKLRSHPSQLPPQKLLRTICEKKTILSKYRHTFTILRLLSFSQVFSSCSFWGCSVD